MAHGAGRLPAPTMDLLAKFIFGDNASFDGEQNLLIRAKNEPIPLPPAPPRLPKTAPILGPSGWPPIHSDKPEPVPPKGRPGWAED